MFCEKKKKFKSRSNALVKGIGEVKREIAIANRSNNADL
jgi:hypothetical protein